jgi:uncharacterized membrane protein
MPEVGFEIATIGVMWGLECIIMLELACPSTLVNAFNSKLLKNYEKCIDLLCLGMNLLL